MKQIWNWLKTSNRWKHLLGGVVLGVLSCNLWCAMLVGISTAGALEYKDYMYNKKLTAWNWIDFGLTIFGALVGFAIHEMIC